MKSVVGKILTACAVTFAVTISAAAQDQGERTIEQYSCKDLMREDGSARDVAIAFLHGYLVGKSGSSRFNIVALEKQTDQFVDYCLDHPADKAEQAMMKMKN